MADSQKVVYVAQNVQQAFLLKNSLEEMGIRADVINASLEGGAGVDYIGWNTLARVVVDEADYEEARKIAMEFDDLGVEQAENHAHQHCPQQNAQEQASGMALHEWPCCPECNEPRITHCPVCQTTGSDFSEADPEFVWGMGLDEIGEDKAHEGQEQEPDEERLVLMCHTCDEPFLPEFSNRCAMCGHRFDDGTDVDLKTTPPEQVGSRVIAMMVGMAIVFVGLVGYFIWVLKS